MCCVTNSRPAALSREAGLKAASGTTGGRRQAASTPAWRWGLASWGRSPDPKPVATGIGDLLKQLAREGEPVAEGVDPNTGMRAGDKREPAGAGIFDAASKPDAKRARGSEGGEGAPSGWPVPIAAPELGGVVAGAAAGRASTEEEAQMETAQAQGAEGGPSAASGAQKLAEGASEIAAAAGAAVAVAVSAAAGAVADVAMAVPGMPAAVEGAGDVAAGVKIAAGGVGKMGHGVAETAGATVDAVGTAAAKAVDAAKAVAITADELAEATGVKAAAAATADVATRMAAATADVAAPLASAAASKAADVGSVAASKAADVGSAAAGKAAELVTAANDAVAAQAAELAAAAQNKAGDLAAAAQEKAAELAAAAQEKAAELAAAAQEKASTAAAAAGEQAAAAAEAAGQQAGELASQAGSKAADLATQAKDKAAATAADLGAQAKEAAASTAAAAGQQLRQAGTAAAEGAGAAVAAAREAATKAANKATQKALLAAGEAVEAAGTKLKGAAPAGGGTLAAEDSARELEGGEAAAASMAQEQAAAADMGAPVVQLGANCVARIEQLCTPLDATSAMSNQQAAVDHEALKTDPLTLSAWVLAQQHAQPRTRPARGRLTMLINSIAVGCKFVANSVRKAGLAGMMGMAGSSNVQGEDQKKLDIIANEVFKNVLKRSGQCCVLVTEEEDDPIFIEEGFRGDYVVVFDPLDGSSNIDCGVSVGTIFGIYRVYPDSTGSLDDVMRAGKEMVAAGYCMYGSMSYMMITLGNGTSGFTLDPALGEYVITHPKVQVPEKGKIYSINEGNSNNWDLATKKYVTECKEKGYSLRYVGSMVADVHRTLLYGGIFMYPADKKSPKARRPSVDVLSFPIYLGSRLEVERIEQLYKECAGQ
eukprot:scaffold16.g73.t1